MAVQFKDDHFSAKVARLFDKNPSVFSETQEFRAVRGEQYASSALRWVAGRRLANCFFQEDDRMLGAFGE